MTTLEAMAHGTPVICSNVSAMPEVNGDAAIYFNPLDPMDISDKIKLVIKDKNICDRLIINGFERVRNFTWHKTAEKTVALFQSMAVD
jgi:glycosyltransferase involved in cell wall biosynthesis